MNRKLIIHHLSFIIRKSRGFTLVELAVVTSIIVTLLGFITISLVRSQQTASLASVEEVLLADLKQQQLKAMTGDTEGRADADSYGIHFDQTKYTLFHGIYSPEDTSNSVTNLDSNIQFNNSGFNIIFERITGEISQAAIVELKDNTNSKSKKIHMNMLGVITQVESL